MIISILPVTSDESNFSFPPKVISNSFKKVLTGLLNDFVLSPTIMVAEYTNPKLITNIQRKVKPISLAATLAVWNSAPKAGNLSVKILTNLRVIQMSIVLIVIL